jgi:hypothetical protein
MPATLPTTIDEVLAALDEIIADTQARNRPGEDRYGSRRL